MDHPEYTDRELILLTKQSVDALSGEMKEIKVTLDEKFATKGELKNLEDKIQPYISTMKVVGGVVVVGIITALLSLVLIK